MDDLNFAQCQAFSVKSVVCCVQIFRISVCIKWLFVHIHRIHVLKTTKLGNDTAIYYIRNVHNRLKSLNTQKLQTEGEKNLRSIACL